MCGSGVWEEIWQIFDNFLTFSAKERRLRALGGARATRSC